jgi:hypothetical protein
MRIIDGNIYPLDTCHRDPVIVGIGVTATCHLCGQTERTARLETSGGEYGGSAVCGDCLCNVATMIGHSHQFDMTWLPASELARWLEFNFITNKETSDDVAELEEKRCDVAGVDDGPARSLDG